MSGLIVLLGAGASVDAGMPTVADLTKELRQRLPDLRDMNGKRGADFPRLFDRIARLDPTASCNYERFFQWIEFLFKARVEPFGQIVELKIGSRLVDAASYIRPVIGEEIKRLLVSRKTKPRYLARLAGFIPQKGRLDVFILNYDCCVEDACRAAKIDITTGFDPDTHLWKPSVFRIRWRGLNLHKLHGSLRWFPERYGTTLRELRPKDRKQLSPCPAVSHLPELVLGPASKVQDDDPFLTLFCRFTAAMRRARTCVVMGYGYGDDHINAVIKRGLEAGVSVIDVNPGGPSSLFQRRGYSYRHVGTSGRPFPSARDVLTRPEILAPYFH